MPIMDGYEAYASYNGLIVALTASAIASDSKTVIII